MQHTPYTEDQPAGREIEITHPGRVILSGPSKKRPALETLLTKNRFILEKPRERPDGTMPRPGHGLPSHPDPITAKKAGAPNSGHTPGTPHPSDLHFLISPGDHKRSKVCKDRDCEHVGQTEVRPNPLVEHHGKPYEDDPEVTFLTCEWQTPEQIHQAAFIAAGCGWTLRAVTAPRLMRITDPGDQAEPPFVTEMRRELDVIREALGLPPRVAGGAINTPAWAMQSGSHSAMLARLATSSVYNPAGGVLNSGDYAVSAGGAMSVNIAGGVPGGQILIPRTSQPHAGLYYGLNDASVNLPGFTAPSANTWISQVYAQAEDGAYSDPTTAFQVGFVTGAAGSSPVAPTTPVAALALANIAIPSTASSITTGMITSVVALAKVNSAMHQSGDYVSSQVLAGTVTQPTRATGVAYQPNTTKFTFLAVTASVGTGAGAGGANIQIGPTSSPSTTAISGTIAQQGTFTLQIPLTTIVPPGWYYEIVNIANITAISVAETAL